MPDTVVGRNCKAAEAVPVPRYAGTANVGAIGEIRTTYRAGAGFKLMSLQPLRLPSERLSNVSVVIETFSWLLPGPRITLIVATFVAVKL